MEKLKQKGTHHRGEWGSKLGLILAMAGNAVGLGNFWRFPRMAAEYGGGAFMIPYFIALVVVGLPIMITEWHLGRFGGQHGHGTIGPMIYLQAREKVKPKTALAIGTICGALAFAIPVLINSYYNHIVGWSLNYAVQSLFNQLGHGADLTAAYQSAISNPVQAIGFWVIAALLLAVAASKGIKKGIEAWSKIMMPTLYIFGIVLACFALFTQARPETPNLTAIAGLNFLWHPDFSKVNWSVILAACGQIFFTLSLGMGLISNYASFLKKDDDIVVSSIATVSLNEFAEVVLASTAVVPLAYVFMGDDLLQGGSIGFSFISLPNAFMNMPLGNIVGAFWFFLLFFAGFTSALALFNYLVTFIEEGLHSSRKVASWVAFVSLIVIGIPVVLEPMLSNGATQIYFETLDSWVGSYLVLFLGFIELIIVGWFVKPQKTLEGINSGAKAKVPSWVVTVFIRIITPAILLLVIVNATIENAKNGFFSWTGIVPEGGDPATYALWTNLGRGMIIVVFIFGFIMTLRMLRKTYQHELSKQ